jgi:nitrate/nitrite transporter NarK
VAWFPLRRQGLALGIWTVCMPFGSFTMLNLSPHLTAVFGWQAVWAFGASLALLAFILYAIFFKMPESAYSSEGEQVMASASDMPTLKDLFKVLKKRDIWLAGFIFGCVNFVIASVIGSYYPLFLETQLAIPNAEASSISSLPELCSIIIGPVVGLIADRIGKRKPLLVLGCLVMGLASPFVFNASSAYAAAALMCFYGVTVPLVTTSVRLVVPECVGNDHLKAGMGMAVLSFFLNFVGLIGPAAAGLFVVSVGYAEIGIYLFVPIFILALVASMLIKPKNVCTD